MASMEIQANDPSDFSSQEILMCGRLFSPSDTRYEYIILIWKEGQIKKCDMPGLVATFVGGRNGRCAYLDQKMYLLGSKVERICEVFQFDVRQPWDYVRCPPMLTRRSAPQTAVVGGKIFVLGDESGFDFRESGPWGEVYDPCLKRWDTLPVPEELGLCTNNPFMTASMTTAVLHAEEKIILSLSSCLNIYAYDVKIGTWDVYHTLQEPLPFGGPALFVDGVLYGCHAGSLHAYYIAERLSLFITFGKMLLGTSQFDLPSNVYPFLQHLGANFFCFIWKVVGTSSLYFVKFQLSVRKNWNDKPYLHASINHMGDLSVAEGFKLVELLMLDDLDLDQETSSAG